MGQPDKHELIGPPMTARDELLAAHKWEPIADQAGYLAPNAEEIWTKIDDDRGERNVQKLTRYGNLWWTNPDRNKGMYVYYTPTHWSRT